MRDLCEWLIHLPETFAEFGQWLTQDITIGSLTLSPLGIIGTGAVAFVGVILALHIVHLVNPLG